LKDLEQIRDGEPYVEWLPDLGELRDYTIESQNKNKKNLPREGHIVYTYIFHF